MGVTSSTERVGTKELCIDWRQGVDMFYGDDDYFARLWYVRFDQHMDEKRSKELWNVGDFVMFRGASTIRRLRSEQSVVPMLHK